MEIKSPEKKQSSDKIASPEKKESSPKLLPKEEDDDGEQNEHEEEALEEVKLVKVANNDDGESKILPQ